MREMGYECSKSHLSIITHNTHNMRPLIRPLRPALAPHLHLPLAWYPYQLANL